MAVVQKDGLHLLRELMDDAVLRSNLITGQIHGREEIDRVLETLESLYASVSDIRRTSTSVREIIESEAVLSSGIKVTITIVGIRDDAGWISSVVMNHQSDYPLNGLTKSLCLALTS